MAFMKIGIVGYGTVGAAVESLFAGRAEIIIWDVNSDHPYPSSEYASCDCVFLCVPTPSGSDGAADLSFVRDALGNLSATRVILKSTVPPGTTVVLAKEFEKGLCYWPEYISESSYSNPFFVNRIDDVPFVILGGSTDNRAWALAILQQVLGPTRRYFQCSELEAELIKYTENAFFAAKVTFANEMRNLCAAHGADWNVVREGWILDPRVSPMHTLAFAHDPGFGGKCLPKDLQAIVASAQRNGYEPEFLLEVLRSNVRFRKGYEEPT
jgi:UDPglucose 6-dehydrogenase